MGEETFHVKVCFKEKHGRTYFSASMSTKERQQKSRLPTGHSITLSEGTTHPGESNLRDEHLSQGAYSTLEQI
jgi:hypothetical protein